MRDAPHLAGKFAIENAIRHSEIPFTFLRLNYFIQNDARVIPMLRRIPGRYQTTETAARRYLQASEFGTDVSGQFFASAPKKVSGPIEAMRHAHFHDRANQEAAWQAVVKVSGVDLSYPAS
jgi:hypothetical protein